jgi:hypothetical protein
MISSGFDRSPGRQVHEYPKNSRDRILNHGLHHGGQEDVDQDAGLSSGEAFGRHADNFEALASLPDAPIRTDANGAPDHVRVACKPAGPVIVRDYRNRMRAGL